MSYCTKWRWIFLSLDAPNFFLIEVCLPFPSLFDLYFIKDLKFHDCLWWYKSTERYFLSQLVSCLSWRSLIPRTAFLLIKPTGMHLGRRQHNYVMKRFHPLHFSHSQYDTERTISKNAVNKKIWMPKLYFLIDLEHRIRYFYIFIYKKKRYERHVYVHRDTWNALKIVTITNNNSYFYWLNRK